MVGVEDVDQQGVEAARHRREPLDFGSVLPALETVMRKRWR
jgi:hypothetical protein